MRIEQSGLGGWVRGLGPKAGDIDTGIFDAIYAEEGKLPPRKRDPSDPFWLPGP